MDFARFSFQYPFFGIRLSLNVHLCVYLWVLRLQTQVAISKHQFSFYLGHSLCTFVFQEENLNQFFVHTKRRTTDRQPRNGKPLNFKV